MSPLIYHGYVVKRCVWRREKAQKQYQHYAQRSQREGANRDYHLYNCFDGAKIQKSADYQPPTLLFSTEIRTFALQVGSDTSARRPQDCPMKATKQIFVFATAMLAALFASCGEDRSGEQPFAPTVATVSATTEGRTALLEGEVIASPNSTLLECGFVYGNDTLKRTISLEAQNHFYALSDTLAPGDYYATAFARNYMGVSYGDTLTFRIP